MLGEVTESNATWLTSALWPGSSRTPTWRRRDVRRFVAVPSAQAPSQLLPWSPTAIVAAASRHSDDRTRLRSLADGAGVLGLLALAPFKATYRLGLSSGTGPSLVDHLRSTVEPAIRSAVVLCGPLRANQKPVLQLTDRWGRTVAFAKVAWNPLTSELLDAERTALDRLARRGPLGFSVPTVIGAGTFAGAQWLAMTPVGVSHRLARQQAATFDLARAVERTADPWTGPAADSPFVDRLRSSARGLPSSGPIVDRLVDRHGGSDIVLRAAHGDFVPWNILSGRPSFAVWDWERYDVACPVGFDRLHHEFQLEIHRRSQTTAAAVATVDAGLGTIVPELDAAAAVSHLDWYIADLMCRYERDGEMTGVAATTERARELAAVLEQRSDIDRTGRTS